MGDPGFLSGFIGIDISMIISGILGQINIAVHCSEELESLKNLLIGLQGINSAMQKCRVALNSGQLNYSQKPIPYDVNKWFLDLDTLLHQANETVQHCTIPTWDLISRYKTSKKLVNLTRRIREHRENAALMGITVQLLQSIHELKKETSLASSNSGPHTERSMYVEERLVIGQDEALLSLEQLVLQNTPRIGVVGKGGSGKTLLLKRLFNRVENLFSNDLLLWVTVSSTPSFPALRTELYKQISFKLKERSQCASEDDIKIWLYAKLSERKFRLFLDDVWETCATHLFEELCVPTLHSFEAEHNNVIIVSSRSHRALLQTGIPYSSPAIVDVQSLIEDDSWKLFSCHAFPYNHGNMPPFINEEVAKSVCKECGGLPLAIKVIGRAMSGAIHLQEWEFTLRRLRNAEPMRTAGDVQQYLYDRLRLSYDCLADLDASLPLCFLYLAAFPEDAIISTYVVTLYWIGEGLVTGDNARVTARTYVNLLADRCLIEVVHKDIDGLVTRFMVHDVLHDLARYIGLREENCFFHADRGLKEFPDTGGHLRISLFRNKLSTVPNSLRGPHIRSLIMDGNIDLKAIPTKVIASLTCLQMLDLSMTSLQSLPKSIGRLKHLICLRLRVVPIKRLPMSLTSLNMLQILDLYKSSIRKLPSRIHRLCSLRILDIGNCHELQYIPKGISKLTSLECLRFEAAFSPRDSINDLTALKCLKRLSLFNNGKAIQHGTLAKMIDMEQLYMKLTMMEKLPQDISAMSKLRDLFLHCPDLTGVEDSSCRFNQLRTLTLFRCKVLKELGDLHKLVCLKQLVIFDCPEIEELPKEFGERGAFQNLEVLSLMWLDKLAELPEVDEAAMPSLSTLSIVGCTSLKMLAEVFWNLKSVKKIEIYGCPMVLENLQMEESVKKRKRAVQTITISLADTQELWAKYHEMLDGDVYMRWGKFWSNEYFQTSNSNEFFRSLNTLYMMF